MKLKSGRKVRQSAERLGSAGTAASPCR